MTKDKSDDQNVSHAGINSNFAKASPESNVGPAGAEQSSYGQAHPPGETRGKPWPEQNRQPAEDKASD